MSKTSLSINGRRGTLSLVVTAELKALLPALFPTVLADSEVDLSSVTVSMNETTPPTTEIQETFVIGDDNAIVDDEPSRTRTAYQITFLYTRGQEQLTADNLDPHTMLRTIRQTRGASPVFQWAIGANPTTGDEQYTTDSTETRLISVGTPTPSGQTGKIQLTATFSCPEPTLSIIA